MYILNSFYLLHFKNLKGANIYINIFKYSIHIIQVFSFVCVLTWSLLGVKNCLGLAYISLL